MRPLSLLALAFVLGAEAFMQTRLPPIHSTVSGNTQLCRARAPVALSKLRRGLATVRMNAETASTSHSVGEKDSGRHLDDTSERSKAVADLYAPFWEYAAEV